MGMTGREPTPYSLFPREVGRAFLDLIARIDATAPRNVVDLGCGRGDLTGVLARRWPQAAVDGIDSSPEMIATAAVRGLSGVSCHVAEVGRWQPARDVDVIVSSNVLQDIPLHLEMLATWAIGLPQGGWLAIQIPDEHDSDSHVLMRRLADSARWQGKLRDAKYHVNHVAEAKTYAEVLIEAGLATDVWTATYLHLLEGAEPVLDWLRCTALPPLLAKPGPGGTLFPVRRVFAVGQRP
jgi:trans-aconitate 2-methyltransferase